MRLCFDIGNTRAKCALYDGERQVDCGVATEPFVSTLLRHYGHDIECAVASVVGQEPDWSSLLPKEMPLHKLSYRSPLPFTLSCKQPATIGADRLAACLGAWTLYPNQALVVVDAGTCITLDYLNADGTYSPGVIMPGMQMCLNAMHEHTALLPQLHFDPNLEPDHHVTDTEDSILKGVAYMGLSAVKQILLDAPLHMPLFTGGNGAWLHNSIGCNSEYHNDLLFVGLNALAL